MPVEFQDGGLEGGLHGEIAYKTVAFLAGHEPRVAVHLFLYAVLDNPVRQ